METKIKVLVLGDDLRSHSGVANQLRYIVNGLHDSGKFSFIYLGGAIQHKDYRPVKFEQYGDDLILYPVDGYGNPDIVRSVLRTEKPDILLFMTDPRFYEWLFSIENEIRPNVPMVYYNIWDAPPAPTFNKKWYESCDLLVAISKLTDKLVKEVSPNVDRVRIPHAVDNKVFQKLPGNWKEQLFPDFKDKFILFFNSRNARRKMTGSLIYWFKKFLDKVGYDKATLIMHTNPFDPNGPNLNEIVKNWGLDNGQVLFSTESLSPLQLAQMYNAVDLSVLLSHSEGFGLMANESLACGTPILVTMTGGLQEQVTDGKKWFGKGIRPVARPLVGSQDVPWIFEDIVDEKSVVSALEELYKTWKTKPEKYNKMGLSGQKHIHKNYNFDKFKEKWVDVMLKCYENNGSWETRKNYKPWELKEV